jgi:hypothetical protein
MKDKQKEVLQATAQVLRALWDIVAVWMMSLLLNSLSDDAAKALVDGLQDQTVIFSAPGMDFSDEAAIRAYLDCVKDEIERMAKAGEN